MYRKGRIEDCKEIYGLICEMENRELPFERFYEIFRDQLSDNRYYCLVWDFQDQVMGVLNLRFEEQLHHGGLIGEIMEFAVMPRYRKQGIGKEMFSEACRIAKERGCMQIEVACNQLRTDTHRFYNREGMHNFHFKFSKPLTGSDTPMNVIGK